MLKGRDGTVVLVLGVACLVRLMRLVGLVVLMVPVVLVGLVGLVRLMVVGLGFVFFLPVMRFRGWQRALVVRLVRIGLRF